MNLFESELLSLFGDGAIIGSPMFICSACFGTLGGDLRVRAQFVVTDHADHYDALRVTVINRRDGPVDALTLGLRDLWGMKPVPGNPNFRDGVAPHIWVYGGKPEWYAFQPSEADRVVLRNAVRDYLDVFRELPSRNAPQRRKKPGKER